MWKTALISCHSGKQFLYSSKFCIQFRVSKPEEKFRKIIKESSPSFLPFFLPHYLYGLINRSSAHSLRKERFKGNYTTKFASTLCRIRKSLECAVIGIFLEWADSVEVHCNFYRLSVNTAWTLSLEDSLSGDVYTRACVYTQTCTQRFKGWKLGLWYRHCKMVYL